MQIPPIPQVAVLPEIEIHAPVVFDPVDHVAREQVMLIPMGPVIEAGAHAATGEVERLEVRSQLQPVVTELFSGALGLFADSLMFGIAIVQLGPESIMNRIVHRRANIVIVRDILGSHPAQCVNLVEMVAHRTVLGR